MKRILTTKSIDIEYTEKTYEEAKKIKEIIDRNHHIFHDLFLDIDKISFTNEQSERTINITSISDLKEYLHKCLPPFMSDVIPQIETANNGNAEAIYLKFLLLDKYQTVLEYAPEFANNPEYEMYVNSILSLSATLYYMNQNTPEKLVDFIFDMSPEEKEKIINWLNTRNRYKLFNMLLDDQYQLIIQAEGEDKAKDPFLKKNLDNILDAIQEDFINSQIYLHEDIPTYISKLSKDELDKLCEEFFFKIDKTGTWFKKYNQIKEEQIVCTSAEENPSIIWCCIPCEDTFVIIAPLTGTISDFRSLVHEFTHLISLETLDNDENLPPSIQEYPSIVIEQEAIKFLEEKGYSKEIIDALRIERIVWTEENILDVNPILRYLAKYLKKGPITFEKEKEEATSILKNYPSYGNDELLEIISKYIKDDYESLTQKIDIQNTFLLQFPDYVARAYPYVISMYLAKKTEERIEEDPSIVDKVIEITNNLKNETPESIITKLNLPIRQDYSTTDKQKKYIKSKKDL